MSYNGSIPMIVPGLSQFDLSKELKTTIKFGEVTPIYAKQLMPGDDFLIRPEFQSRFIALDAPIMHRIDLEHHWFFVPNRLCWDNFEDFIVPEGLNQPKPAVPYAITHNYGAEPTSYLGTLLDHFDLLKVYHNLNDPSKRLARSKFAWAPLAAYWKIINDWYRDENLQEEVYFSKDVDGMVSDSINVNHHMIQPFRRSYHKDYFTSALPWLQKGPASFVPFIVRTSAGNTQRVTLQAAYIANPNDKAAYINRSTDPSIDNNLTYHLAAPTDAISQIFNLVQQQGGQYMGQGSLYINDIRLAAAIQQIFEKCARGGSRYVEYVFSQFGVVSPDARLQRAEYIIGNSSPIQIGEVLQSSQTTQDSPLATPAGTAFVAGHDDAVRYKAKEHGILIGLASLMYRNGYGSGQDREWRKFDVYDFYNPSLAGLGEQPVYVSELGNDLPASMVEQGAYESDAIFGYMPRFEEYRCDHDRVHGDFRHSLNFWHLARIFENGTIGGDNIPSLNAAFIQSGNPSITSRIFPTNDARWHEMLVQYYFDVQALRPVVKYGIPGMTTI